jgi:hypothetical protein
MSTEQLPCSAYKFQQERTFAMRDPDYTLRVAIIRDSYKSDFKIPPFHATSSVNLYLQRKDKNKERGVSTVASFGWYHSTFYIEEMRGEIPVLHLVKQNVDLRLSLPNGIEIQDIKASERDAILALLKELRGLKIRYTADLFGFLRKDGSDKPQDIELPFPELVADTNVDTALQPCQQKAI